MVDFGIHSSFFLPEAVQVLVSSLADESPMVREASMASLKEISALYLLSSLRSYTFTLRHW